MTKTKKANLIYTLIFVTAGFLFTFLFSNSSVKAATCQCNNYQCNYNTSCNQITNGSKPYLLNYTVFGDFGCCNDNDICYNEYFNREQPCGTCHFGYGTTVDCGSGVSGATGTDCVSSCTSGGGGGSGECSGVVGYSCDPNSQDVEGKVYARFYDANSDYNPDDPSVTPAQDTFSTNGVAFLSEGAFDDRDCKDNWYTEDFTGSMYIDGQWRFRLITDENYSVNGEPSNNQCCGSNCRRCERSWDWYNPGCSYGKKSKCEDAYGCEWVSYRPFCSDDQDYNTGLKVGHKTVNDNVWPPQYAPDGQIDSSGNISGLTTVIRSHDGNPYPISSDGFTGDFEAGWYPFQAWYTVRIDELEKFQLQRAPVGTNDWQKVPPSEFVACGGGQVETVDIKGEVWEVTDVNNCTPQNEIDTSNSNVSISSEGSAADVSIGDGYPTYEIPGVESGNGLTMSVGVLPDSNDFYTYELACVSSNAEVAAQIMTPSSVLYNAAGDGVVNLGFKRVYPSWFQAINGGIYVGDPVAGDSISMRVPDDIDVAGGFANYLIDGVGSLFGFSSVSVQDSAEDRKIVNNDNKYYFENIGSAFNLENISFSPPANATDINSLDGLEPEMVYNAGDSLSSISGTYDLNGEGVAVVYISNDIVFDADFKSSSDNERVVLIVNGNVEIDSDVGYISPTPSSEPNIEASIIASGSITFPSVGSDPDSTIVVEGPLVADGKVEFGRNRGINNNYPAEVVKFNPIYALNNNLPAISLTRILWLIDY